MTPDTFDPLERFNAGDRVAYWSGARRGEPTGWATVESGPLMFGGVECYRIRRDGGAHDNVATTHLERSINAGSITAGAINAGAVTVADAPTIHDPKLAAAVDATFDRLEAQRLNTPAGPDTPSAAAEELAPMCDGLFPPSPAERLDVLAQFVRREREQRVGMLMRHQDRRAYWQDTIDEADQALHHIEALRREL